MAIPDFPTDVTFYVIICMGSSESDNLQLEFYHIDRPTSQPSLIYFSINLSHHVSCDYRLHAGSLAHLQRLSEKYVPSMPLP